MQMAKYYMKTDFCSLENHSLILNKLPFQQEVYVQLNTSQWRNRKQYMQVSTSQWRNRKPNFECNDWKLKGFYRVSAQMPNLSIFQLYFIQLGIKWKYLWLKEIKREVIGNNINAD